MVKKQIFDAVNFLLDNNGEYSNNNIEIYSYYSYIQKRLSERFKVFASKSGSSIIIIIKINNKFSLFESKFFNNNNYMFYATSIYIANSMSSTDPIITDFVNDPNIFYNTYILPELRISKINSIID